jgi:DNA-binding NtrC family response regulator
MVNHYSWPGNIRQLKNVVEQISVIETERELDGRKLQQYLPTMQPKSNLLAQRESEENINERELMYKFLFDMKKDLTELKKLVVEIINKGANFTVSGDQAELLNRLYTDVESTPYETAKLIAPAIEQPVVQEVPYAHSHSQEDEEAYEVHEVVEESLSLEDQEKDLIKKALEKHRGKRKYAALELGISERTLYRKIKEYNLAE